MPDLEFYKDIVEPADTKIVLFVMDGLGGLPQQPNGPTEMESAKIANLDALAAKSLVGLQEPVGPGITPGSGPGHLALFGYDPIKYLIGRGVLEALGIDFDLQREDLAARGNFASMDEAGRITDRRAGRISTEKNVELCAMLRRIRLAGVEVFVEPVREHRFVLVLRGPDLAGDVTENDPQKTGLPKRQMEALTPTAKHTADLLRRFVAEADRVLADQHPANTLLLRGFAKRPTLPTLQEVFGLRCAAIAVYPMYRGLAKLAGMDILKPGPTLREQFETLATNYHKYDYFYVHYKKTDTAGEDGDFERKVQALEEADAHLPELLALKPAVVMVTGDHSTPAVLRSHSWHPVPVLLSSDYCRPDSVTQFNERACAQGGLGTFPAVNLMPLAMANALRFTKYGA